MALTDAENIRPHLKLGSIIAPRSNSTYVGRSDYGLEVSSPARAALAAMDGSRTCEELSASLGIPLSEIVALMGELDHAGLIDTQTSKISVHSRFHSPNAHRASHDSDDSSDGAVQQLQAKLQPELSFTTWLADVRDGGVSTMSRRQEWHVSIFGGSRIATLLYGILLSSGISRTSLHGLDDHKTINEEDMCAGFLHPSDIGLLYANRTQELSRELSLFPVSKSPTAKNTDGKNLRRMMVSVGQTPADQVQEWLSSGFPHLIVDNPDSARISLGPIVIPGQTPCSRCVSMALEDQNPAWREIAMQKLIKPAKEVPVAVAHHVAGLAALELLRFVDEGQSDLIGRCTRIDYHRPTISVQQAFTRHPACGCNW